MLNTAHPITLTMSHSLKTRSLVSRYLSTLFALSLLSACGSSTETPFGRDDALMEGQQAKPRPTDSQGSTGPSAEAPPTSSQVAEPGPDTTATSPQVAEPGPEAPETDTTGPEAEMGSEEGAPQVGCAGVALWALSITVLDAVSESPIEHATVVAHSAANSEELEHLGTGVYSGAAEQAGTYSVDVTADGYSPATLNDITVERSVCNVITESRTVGLEPEGMEGTGGAAPGPSN